MYPIITSVETVLGGMEGVTESTYWEPRLRSPWAVDVKTDGTLASISRSAGGAQPLRLAYDGSAGNLSGPSTQLVSVVSGWVVGSTMGGALCDTGGHFPRCVQSQHRLRACPTCLCVACPRRSARR